MPLTIADFPAAPECHGTQWTVTDQDALAALVATVLVGRADHAARVLEGVQQNAFNVSAAMRAALHDQLHPANDATKWHRDGVLFEIICWVAARMTAAPNDIISNPHVMSTQQGADTIRVHFDPATRNVSLATIFEQKCTTNARAHFRDRVVPAFKDWMAGKRDNQLIDIAIGLLSAFNLTDSESTAIYDRLVQDRPFAFKAALTVTPLPFATAQCVAMFTNYQEVTPVIDHRHGDTFPLADIRAWFNEFSAQVWDKIEAGNV
jgi:hypothetical protein